MSEESTDGCRHLRAWFGIGNLCVEEKYPAVYSYRYCGIHGSDQSHVEQLEIEERKWYL